MGSDYSQALRYPIMWNNGAQTHPANATAYFGVAVYNGTETRVATPCPFSGILRALWARVQLAPGVGETHTITVMINGAPGALTCQIADANFTAEDLVNAVAVVRGDLLSFRQVTSLAAAGSRVSIAFEYIRI